MASILRQIVAGPRSPHPETGLDLCYVTDNIIATSGPSSTYPKRAYRNPTDVLVKFLDEKHGTNWSIWEFRAEGTGYPDSEVYGRIRHYPWPDHHPPPFALIPNIMASMRDWLKGPDVPKERVVVVHCKAGKGRSGSVACSYLISEEGWSKDEALSRFTLRRMRSGFGEGVSIPSQLRWIGYVDRWTKHRKIYVERQVEVLEVHVWGLREGVKVGVNGYVDEGRTIKSFHTFKTKERLLIDSTSPTDSFPAGLPVSNEEKMLPDLEQAPNSDQKSQATRTDSSLNPSASPTTSQTSNSESGGSAVIFRPSSRIILPSNDIDIDFERRNKAAYGWAMVTSVAHVWFNTFFEGRGPENHGDAITSGVFEIEWDAMDGIRGSPRKGIRALDRLAVVWRALVDNDSLGRGSSQVIVEPHVGDPVPETHAADWKGLHPGIGSALGKNLGLRAASPASANISKASSLASIRSAKMEDDPALGVRSHGPNGEEHIPRVTDDVGRSTVTTSEPVLRNATNSTVGIPAAQRLQQVAQDGLTVGDSSHTSGITSSLQKLNTADLSDERSRTGITSNVKNLNTADLSDERSRTEGARA
ncbi:Telomerase protein component 1 [Pseudocyphellaria aurata]|nr:Telomerase protein component 1 [Pseudocyphellaria aurata]